MFPSSDSYVNMHLFRLLYNLVSFSRTKFRVNIMSSFSPNILICICVQFDQIISRYLILFIFVNMKRARDCETIDL